MTKTVEEKERVVIRFAGDSGDGMQLTGDRFTSATAVLGNDLATLPDFPAEIRAPAGTVHGVSAFQIQFASSDITTPGDHADVLVAMNPAALKADLSKVDAGGIVIVNEDAFTQRNVEKAGYAADPTTDGSLEGYQLYKVPMTSITVRATEGVGIGKKEAERAKNMFALGLVSWMFGRPTETTLDWLERKFGGKQEIYDANVAAFKAGYNFGETTELFAHSYKIAAAPVDPGTYRNVAGSTALSWGLIAASQRSGLPLFYASYPITPASELLHELSRHKNFGVDHAPGRGRDRGRQRGARRGVRRPARGDRHERPRHGPQGRDARPRGDHGAADGDRRRAAGRPLDRPAHEDGAGRPAARDVRPSRREPDADRRGVLARPTASRSPWKPRASPCATGRRSSCSPTRSCRTHRSRGGFPRSTDLPEIDPNFAAPDGDGFLPYARDEKLARPWAVPGTPGLVHRIGGLEREDGTGNISYDPENHERMTHLRQAKVDGIADDIPPLEVDDPSGEADLLVLGWGSSLGTIRAAATRVRDARTARSRRRTCATSTRSRRTPATS